MKAETIVTMLLRTMPDELAPSVIMTLANVAVQVATGEVPSDEIPHDKWEMALAVIKAVAKNEMLIKMSEKEAEKALKKAKQS